MAGKVAATDFRITCAWCKGVMHEGHPTGPDQISHAMCCPCKSKYFPTLEHGSSVECQFELDEREHEDDEDPVAMNPFTDSITYRRVSYHIDHEKCVHCGMERTLDPKRCECGAD